MSSENKSNPQKRISFDLRGDNAVAFEEFRQAVAEKLGFDISPSKTVLWAMNQVKRPELEIMED